MMYIDSLWNYYNGGDFTLTDEQYDRLREELNWQGSGFPTLRRYEVQFVEAAISYARGDPKVSDKEYEELKRKVKAAGKRDDVTALLLYTKGQQLLEPEQFNQLRDEMSKLSIDVGLRGATCTLSNTSADLIADSGTVTMWIVGNSVNGDGAPSNLDRWNRLSASVGEGTDNGQTRTVFSGNGEIEPPAPAEDHMDLHEMGAKLRAHWLGLLGFGAVILVILFCGFFLRYVFSRHYKGRSNLLRLRIKHLKRGDQL